MTGVGLISTFYDTIRVSRMRFSQIFDVSKVWVFDSVFLRFGYHLGSHIVHELSYPDKIAVVSIWFRMVLRYLITQVCKDFLTSACPPNINIWLVIQFSIPTGRFFLIPLWILIIDTMHWLWCVLSKYFSLCTHFSSDENIQTCEMNSKSKLCP